MRVNAPNGLPLYDAPSENSALQGTIAHETYVALLNETPQNEKWYQVYAKLDDGSLKEGWCDGEHLEKTVKELTAKQDCYIRSEANKVDSTRIKNPDDSFAIIRTGNKIQLWENGIKKTNSHSWYTVNYNKTKAFVTADDNSFDETTTWITLPTN